MSMAMKRKGQIPDNVRSKEQDLTRDEMRGAKERLSQTLFWELSLGGKWSPEPKERAITVTTNTLPSFSYST